MIKYIDKLTIFLEYLEICLNKQYDRQNISINIRYFYSIKILFFIFSAIKTFRYR